MGIKKSNPIVRPAEVPAFLAEKYKSIKGLLAAAAGSETAFKKCDPARFAAEIKDIPTLFKATIEEIEAAFVKAGCTPTDAERCRIVVHRHLLFADLGSVRKIIGEKFDDVIRGMPKTLDDIENAGGGRDLLDPFIVALDLKLLSGGSIQELIRNLVAHKCLMKLEDLIGHLHEEVLGRAGGNERVPEPEGVRVGRKIDKQTWHETKNPYPGADARLDKRHFYQLKNKTGSAKGSDGEKLGRQFVQLGEKYPGSQRFYMSMIGRTLVGHRSMGAFLRTDPDAEVLVGLTAFQQIGKHRDTADIVLDLYLEEFDLALARQHYDFSQIVTTLATAWVERHGKEDPAHAMLRDSITSATPDEQSSKTRRGAAIAKQEKAKAQEKQQAEASQPVDSEQPDE